MVFPYQMLLGELIFTCVIVHLDIGYSMSLLSRFAEYPSKVHYQGLKSVARYLRETKDRPIIYWKKNPMIGLLKGTFVPYKKLGDAVYSFPEDPYLVTIDVDASHVTDRESRRCGHKIKIFVAAVLWLEKLQGACNFVHGIRIHAGCISCERSQMVPSHYEQGEEINWDHLLSTRTIWQ